MHLVATGTKPTSHDVRSMVAIGVGEQSDAVLWTAMATPSFRRLCPAMTTVDSVQVETALDLFRGDRVAERQRRGDPMQMLDAALDAALAA